MSVRGIRNYRYTSLHKNECFAFDNFRNVGPSLISFKLSAHCPQYCSNPALENMSFAAPQLDVSKASTWVFPQSDNFAIREYQVNICRHALFLNTLVCLPTGLGKTLIAAVVMYNYYRWFPTGNAQFTIAENVHFDTPMFETLHRQSHLLGSHPTSREPTD